MEPKAEETRPRFEERVYARYFASQIKRTGTGGCTELAPAPDMKNKDELLAKGENGLYIDDAIGAMWFGWCLAHSEFVPK